MTTPQVLSDEQRQAILADNSLDTIDAVARAIESATLKALGGQEPVYWEWRHLGTHPDAVDFGKWSEWARVKGSGPLHTAKERLDDLRAYIADGYKYELRALYTLPPAQPAPVDERDAFDPVAEGGRIVAASARKSAKDDNWRKLFWELAKALNCLPSSFVDGNEHVLKKAQELQARAALQGAQAPQAGGWLPIETAPKDGRRMFVVCGFNVTNENAHVRNYTTDPYCVWPGDSGGWVRWPHTFPPTHWCPLPPAPQATKGQP